MVDLIFLFLQRVLPKRALSDLCAKIGSSTRPVWLKNFLIRAFIKIFKVDMSEALGPDPRDYASFSDFFTRPLKPGSRPISGSDIVSPADGVINQFGNIENPSLIQAKGNLFSVYELLSEKPSSSVTDYNGGAFITIYLSPKDYHRFHMPASGALASGRYIPGTLYSVNNATAQGLENLYVRNERYIANFVSDRCAFTLIAVGAMIVAGIETVWSGLVNPSESVRRETKKHYLKNSIFFGQGEEVGRFRMGSTIILLFPKNTLDWDEKLYIGKDIKMGQSLGNWS